MQLSDTWRITSDPYNFILERLEEVKTRGTGVVRQEWGVVGYYGTLPQIASAITRHVCQDTLAVNNFNKFIKSFSDNINKVQILLEDTKK